MKSNKFSIFSNPKYYDVSESYVKLGKMWYITPLRGYTYSCNLEIVCSVCEKPRWGTGMATYTPLYADELIENDGNYYYICGKNCRNLFELNPVGYE